LNKRKVLIIAEAGVNHNGDIKIAKEMIDAAAIAGADVIKFQTFISNKLVSKFAKKAEYQKKDNDINDTQLEMIKKLELSFANFLELKRYCDEQKIIFVSTPFDIQSIEFLSDFDMPFWKIPSGEITNLPYLIQIAKTNKPIVMSTGMAKIAEVIWAVDILKSNKAGDITLLHCNTEYPTPFRDVNLRAMEELKEKTGLAVGYSDHTLGIEVSIAAVALGASIIEKHFTLNKNMEGPDHKSSLEPNELKNLVKAIRNVEMSLGDGKKEPTASELKNKEIARKSIVASRKIEIGTIFSEDNVTVKRPGNGISPTKWFDVLGKEAKRNFEEDELIEI